MPTKTLRPYQVRDFNAICDNHYDLLVNSPTGSGKTTVIVAGIAALLTKRLATHIIVAAPAVAIERGFSARDFDRVNVNGEHFAAGPGLIVGARDSDDSNVAAISTYLAIPGQQTHALACTHAALSYNHLRLPKDCTGIILFIDEAHHAPAKKLAKFLKQFKTRGGRLIFVTATPYRADGQPVALPEMEKIIRSLAEHMQDPNGPYAPTKIHSELVRVFTASDAEFADPRGIDADRLLKALVDKFVADNRPKAVFKVTSLRFARQLIRKLKCIGAKVIDATGVGQQQHFLQALEAERDAPYAETSDCVVGIERVKEGLDWPVCSTVYVAGFPGSQATLVQLLGRAMRPKGSDYPAQYRDVARIVVFVPCDESEHGALSRDHSRRVLTLACYLGDVQGGQQWWADAAIGFGLRMKRPFQDLATNDELAIRVLVEDELAKNGPLSARELRDLVAKDPIAKRFAPELLTELVVNLLAEKVARQKNGRKALEEAIERATKKATAQAEAGATPVQLWGAAHDAILDQFCNETIEHSACADQLHLLTGENIPLFTARMRDALGNPLALDEIKDQIRAFHAANQRFPSGADKSDSGLGCNWSVLDNNLRNGFRDIPKGCTLSAIVGEVAVDMGIDHRQSHTPDKVREAIRQHLRKHGKGPACDSKEPCEAFPPRSWKNVSQWMRVGERGLTEFKEQGISLAQLVEQIKLEPEFAGLVRKKKLEFAPITHEEVAADMVRHFVRHGKWPSKTSKELAETLGVKFATLGVYAYRGSRMEKITWGELKQMAMELYECQMLEGAAR